MKNFCLLLLALVFIFSCNSGSRGPDISGIKIDLVVKRFDKDLYSVDTIGIDKSLSALHQGYPLVYPVFIKNILGLDEQSQYEGVRQFIRQNSFIYDTLKIVFDNFNDSKKEFEKAFRYVKYYFPEYRIPELVTIFGPVDALAETARGEATPDFILPGQLCVSLQFYLGKDYSVYHDPFFVYNVAPEFRSRRFDKKYMVADGMKLITDDIFPDRSKGKGLVEQMIEKGKQWWLLDHFLPNTPDSIKTGYTAQQLDWCNENEGLIWNAILTSEKDIFTKDPAVIQNYIGEAPFTQVLSPASPGNIGPWIGWQIVKKIAENNPSLNISDVMKKEPGDILELSKYKPK